MYRLVFTGELDEVALYKTLYWSLKVLKIIFKHQMVVRYQHYYPDGFDCQVQGLFGGPCFFTRGFSVIKSKLRTIVYIDGFNFYYGQLKDSPHKWLDLTMLFRTVLGEQNELVKIKYFTARVQPTDRDPQVNIRQDIYFRALAAHCPEVEIHLGHFLRHRVFAENANPPPNKIEIFKTEEKGSDVNLALHLLNDAWADAYDCAVVVSNDSDLATALQMVKEQHKKVIGLITPGAPKRKPSWQLKKYVSFFAPIRTWSLERSLMPDVIPNTEIRKPDSW